MCYEDTINDHHHHCQVHYVLTWVICRLHGSWTLADCINSDADQVLCHVHDSSIFSVRLYLSVCNILQADETWPVFKAKCSVFDVPFVLAFFHKAKATPFDISLNISLQFQVLVISISSNHPIKRVSSTQLKSANITAWYWKPLGDSTVCHRLGELWDPQ